MRGEARMFIPDVRPRVPGPIRIVWVWTMVFLGIVLYAIAWFTLGTAAMAVISAIEGSYTFAAPWSSVVDQIKKVILWHPIFAMIGWLLWGFLNSMKREVRTWQV